MFDGQRCNFAAVLRKKASAHTPLSGSRISDAALSPAAMKGTHIGFDQRLARCDELFRFERREQLAFAQKYDAMRKIKCLIQIVRHQQNCLLQPA